MLQMCRLGDPELLQFWRGLPRDTEGRWEKYHRLAPHYFAGYMPKPRRLVSDFRFMKANIRGAIFLLRSIPKIEKGMNDDEFLSWFTALHKKQTFTPGMSGKILTIQITNQRAHTPMVIDDVVKKALLYGDKYRPLGTRTLFLPGIARDGLPKDVWVNKSVAHVYPHPRYYPDYLHMINLTLTHAVKRVHRRLPLNRKLENFARFYQYCVNARMFIKTNHSLALNVCNTLLRELGLKGIESGIIDFVAMRLSPKNFARFFIEEAHRVNP
jgi:hypothetical protein